MDFHALQHKLFQMDPVDPREDLAKLRGQATGDAPAVVPDGVDYIKESAAVPEGSLQMDKDYSVNDFAALAGVAVTEKKQRDADQVRGSEPMPSAKPGREEHPFQDRLVGEQELDELEVVDRSSVSQPIRSPEDLNRQLQTLSQSMAQLQTTIENLTQQAQQLQQQMQIQAQQTRANPNQQRVSLSQMPSMDLNSKQNKKRPVESLDNIKDSLYAALNKKMGV